MFLTYLITAQLFCYFLNQIWHCNSICAIWFLALQLLNLRQTKSKSRQNARLPYRVWRTVTCPGQRWSCTWTPFAKARSSIWRQQTHRGSPPSFDTHIPVEIQKPSSFLTTHPLLLGGENLPNDLPHCGQVDVQVPHLVFDRFVIDSFWWARYLRKTKQDMSIILAKTT